ncbi:MAG TPA: hypothetical protein VM536_03340 [Chloroflexia bacterium]|nr:hypothetical protein [Chloroflexia bacterium]
MDSTEHREQVAPYGGEATMGSDYDNVPVARIPNLEDEAPFLAAEAAWERMTWDSCAPDYPPGPDYAIQ